jgi:hypothetical protein
VVLNGPLIFIVGSLFFRFEGAEAYWKARSGLFTSQLVRGSLDAQPSKVAYLEDEFAVDFQELMA